LTFQLAEVAECGSAIGT